MFLPDQIPVVSALQAKSWLLYASQVLRWQFSLFQFPGKSWIFGLADFFLFNECQLQCQLLLSSLYIGAETGILH